MNIGEFYKLAVREGIKHDPRSKAEVLKYLASVRAEYESLPAAEKEMFDKEKFSNPYSDTRVLFGSFKKNVNTIMVGIDVETPELLLADRLKSKGVKIDLAVSHHPQGYARAGLYRVMSVLHNILKQKGVAGARVRKMVDERIDEVLRKLLAGNSTRPSDAARLLNMPLMCMHTVTDNFAYNYFDRLFKKKRPARVEDILNHLYSVPEYKIAMKNSQGPRVILGKRRNKCGKILIEMTGGTEGPKNLYKELVKKKINTLVSMHMSEEHLKKARKFDINVIIAGHISSDTLGINLLLDEIEKQKRLKVIACSGFTRIRR